MAEMPFFERLPKKTKDKAYKLLAEELLDGFIFEYSGEDGDELSTLLEERLIRALDDGEGTDMMSKAREFYTS